MKNPGIPKINPEVMRSSNGDDKKKGLLAALLLKLGVGGGQTAGGAAAGAGIFSGLLASKAGLVGLIVAGSSVAAGIGYMATRSAPRSGYDGARQSIFAAAQGSDSMTAEAEAVEASAKNPAPPGSGASRSLDYFHQANPSLSDEAEDAQDAAAASDESVEEAETASAKTADSGVEPPRHGSGGASRPKMVKSSGFGGRSAGTQLKLAAQTGLSGGIGGNFQKTFKAPSRTESMRGATRTKATARRRSASARGSGLASKQAADTRRVTRRSALASGHETAAQYGATYDGSGRGGGGQIGATGGTPSGGGQGTGGEGVQGKPNASTVENMREVPDPPSAKEDSENQTPYQHLLYAAIGCIAIAGIALFCAGKFSDEAKAAADPVTKSGCATAAQALAGLAVLAALAAVAIGIMLSQDPYGQMMQGMMFAMIGGVFAIQGAAVLLKGSEASAEGETKKESIWASIGKSIGNSLK